jgi:hypothetical protein
MVLSGRTNGEPDTRLIMSPESGEDSHQQRHDGYHINHSHGVVRDLGSKTRTGDLPTHCIEEVYSGDARAPATGR